MQYRFAVTFGTLSMFTPILDLREYPMKSSYKPDFTVYLYGKIARLGARPYANTISRHSVDGMLRIFSTKMIVYQF